MVRAWIIANLSRVRDTCIGALVASVVFVRDFATRKEDGANTGCLNLQPQVAGNTHRRVAFLRLSSPKMPRMLFMTPAAVWTNHSWLLALTSLSVVMIQKMKSYLQVVGNTCSVTTITHVLTLAPRSRVRRCGKKRSGFSTMNVARGSLIIIAITVAVPWLSRVTALLACRNRSRTNHVPTQHPFLPVRPWTRSLHSGRSKVIQTRSSVGQT